VIYTIIKQELRLILKRPANLANSLAFFFIAISIFAISFDKQLNIGAIWICLLFSILLGTINIFKEDFDDGTIEQLFLSGILFELIIAAKMFAAWLIYCLPLIISIPLAATFLKLDSSQIFNLTLVVTLVTLIISFLASFCASLTLSTNSSHSLVTILVLPLAVPIIIFANNAFGDADNFYTSLKFLSALLIFLAPILIIASCAAIKLNISE
jgi:heme exporter protein B